MTQYQDKIEDILSNAERYHLAYYAAETFRGPSLYFHRRSLEARNSADFTHYLEYIYATLNSWGMHRMGKTGSKMQSFEIFQKSVEKIRGEIKTAESISYHSINNEDWKLLGKIFMNINVMASKTTIVGNSKVMAHLLPNIIPPIDREYTLKFLKGNTNIKNDIFYEWRLMQEIISDFFIPVAVDQNFNSLAQSWISNQSQYPWDTSVLKVIDNLVIGMRKV